MTKPIFTFALISVLPAICTAAGNFAFTGPRTDQKLNLSAPINVTWTVNADSPDRQYELVDIWYHGALISGDDFGYTLERNITMTDGGFTWDPTNIADALASTEARLTSGQDHYFEATMHTRNSSHRAVIESGKYAVEGYDRIGSSAGLVGPSWAMMASVMSLALVRSWRT